MHAIPVAMFEIESIACHVWYCRAPQMYTFICFYFVHIHCVMYIAFHAFAKGTLNKTTAYVLLSSTANVGT